MIGSGLVEAEHRCNQYYGTMITNCGEKQNVWNYRHQCIQEILENQPDRYKTTIRSKIIWKYMPILDSESGCLYILLRQQRFDELLRTPEKNQMHYAKSGAICNTQFDQYDKVDEQLEFFKREPVPDNVKEFRKQDFDTLQNCFGQDIKTYVIITFKVHPVFGIVAMQANIVDSKFQLVSKESWTEYIAVGDEPANIPLTGNYEDMENGIILGAKNRIDSKPKAKLKVNPKESKQ